MASSSKKIKLYGFNNLTKSLSFNIYDICYAKNKKHQEEYLEYIDESYNSERLTEILIEVSNIIGASILNIATQDYEPRGASVTMLIAEGANECEASAAKTNSYSVVAHMDKSHITVHTYPESHPDNGISTFRADIDVSTCGLVSPLKALNYLISSFDEDIVIMDYRIRGFTRDVRGKKHYIDDNMHSIQQFLDKNTKDRYQMIDVNVYQENVFHTKMMWKEFDINNYLFGQGREEFEARELAKIEKQLKRELSEMFYARNQ